MASDKSDLKALYDQNTDRWADEPRETAVPVITRPSGIVADGQYRDSPLWDGNSISRSKSVVRNQKSR